MKKTVFSIQVSEHNPNTVYLPYVFPSTVNLKEISFGTRILPCDVITDYLSDNTVTIGSEIYAELGLPFSSDVHIFLHEESIHIGPLIGIFTAGFTESTLRPIGERSLFFANLLSSVEGAYIFVFGSHQINWKEGCISGYFYNEKRWVQYDIPFPHVVYDRLPNRKTEHHRAIARVKQRLQSEYLIPWFNPGFFNKWDVYQLLKEDFNASLYLPETQLFESFEQVEFLLSKYKHVYMKPMNGSLGMSIYQIRYSTSQNEYYCRFRDEEGNKLRKYQSLEVLINHLLSQHDLHTFIVQQGISLLRVNGHPVDFRIHTNKNRNGEWKMSALAAKIAGQGSMTTHVNNGGDIKSMEEIFPDEELRTSILFAMQQATLLLSEKIDEKMEGYIGEIGFDIGMDHEQRIWLFEANSKPGRSIFDHPKLKTSDQLTKELFLQYAIHLTEKSLMFPEEMFP
ncbi:YheC/YheD family protein [Ectobacillus sp. sgz5001026]|uniref:YheC/YheD family endospore coat-associated protein n=1 Tax=Ectobacillus sp. sgz5001026 TaxID=3242473 RepID=UPI0036D3BA49